MARARRGRGEGSIYQRGDGLWVASVSCGFKADGKRRRHVAYGLTKKEAQDNLRHLVGSVAVDANRVRAHDFAMLWLADKKRSISPTTYGRYEQLWRLHLQPHIGHVLLSALKQINVMRLFADWEKAEVSPSTRRKAADLLHSILEAATGQGIVAGAVTAAVTRPRVEKKEMHVLSPEQVGAFLEHSASDPLHALYVMALTTGMREGELFALEWRDIDFTGGFVFVQRTLEEYRGRLRVKPPKSAKGLRRIDLPGLAITELHTLRKCAVADGLATAPVFHDSRGGHLRRPNVARRSFKPLLAKAGLPPIRFHDLRHTHATLLLVNGTNPKVVSERLGHASIEITLTTYSHVLPTIQREAAATLNKLLA